ncbi:hypothetical protein D3C84_812550 [compost metagenome]
MIEDPRADGQRQPVPDAPQPRTGQGKDQEGGKHQIDQGVEIEVTRPEQGELGKEIDIPATQAVPVQPGGSGIRNVSSHRRWVTRYSGAPQRDPGTLSWLSEKTLFIMQLITYLRWPQMRSG